MNPWVFRFRRHVLVIKPTSREFFSERNNYVPVFRLLGVSFVWRTIHS